jgi:hypothetical protein
MFVRPYKAIVCSCSLKKMHLACFLVRGPFVSLLMKVRGHEKIYEKVTEVIGTLF